MEAVLRVSNLSVAFNELPVLENVSFELRKGDSLAIIGPNGSGKTVLLRSLLGTVPYEGEIKWVPEVSLGYVPQKIEADRHLPINLKNLLRAKAKILNIRKEKTEAAMNELAREVGLAKTSLETPIGHLSGGQFQRALIAFALLGRPNVMLLDEPTASIDLPGEEQIYELIHRLQDKYEMTVILVSHELSFVYRYATNVLCLNKQKICYGPPEEALTPKALEELYGPHKYFHHFHHKDDHQ